MTSLTDTHTATAERVTDVLRRASLMLLRASLAVTFIWFGALKVAGTTPVANLVADTVTWIPGVDAGWFVPALGLFDVALGVALLTGRAMRATRAMLVGHLIGTFLVLVVQPEVAFQDGNPLLLTTEGEFVVKNLVLISGLLVLAARQPFSRRTSSEWRAQRHDGWGVVRP